MDITDIIVCVKQVPDTTAVAIDEATGVLKRDGVRSKLNPFDLFALEAAFSLRERYGGSVRTVTMGPPQAKAALLETLYMGADGAVLLSDRGFAGADVCATGYALAQGIRRMAPYDLVICGQQTTDGDTAQVGPETAEFLDVDHAAYVCEIGGADESGIEVTVDLDGMLLRQRMSFPCLLTVVKDINTPRLPSFKRKCELSGREIPVLTIADMEDTDRSKYGLDGSPTQVERIFPPDRNTDREMLRGSAQELSQRLANLLKEGRYV